MVFYQTSLGPPPPPPIWSFFQKKIYPHFLFENASVIAETNFTFGPMLKTNLFLLLQFPRILVPRAILKAVLVAVDKT